MCCEHFFISTSIYPSYMYVFHCLVLVIVGSLSAKKMGKVLFSGQKYQTCRDGWEGSENQYFNGSKMAFHYFVFCAPFSKWRLFALSRAILSP